jgi:hypothetical protein
MRNAGAYFPPLPGRVRPVLMAKFVSKYRCGAAPELDRDQRPAPASHLIPSLHPHEAMKTFGERKLPPVPGPVKRSLRIRRDTVD